MVRDRRLRAVPRRERASSTATDELAGRTASDRPSRRDFVWVGLHEPERDELDQVAEDFGLHPLAVEDALKAHQRPKVEQLRRLAVHRPQDAPLRRGRRAGRDRRDRCSSVTRSWSRSGTARAGHWPTYARQLRGAARACSKHGPSAVVYAIVRPIVDDYTQIALEIEEDIDEVEERVFSPSATNDADRIYNLKREVDRVPARGDAAARADDAASPPARMPHVARRDARRSSATSPTISCASPSRSTASTTCCPGPRRQPARRSRSSRTRTCAGSPPGSAIGGGTDADRRHLRDELRPHARAALDLRLSRGARVMAIICALALPRLQAQRLALTASRPCGRCPVPALSSGANDAFDCQEQVKRVTMTTGGPWQLSGPGQARGVGHGDGYAGVQARGGDGRPGSCRPCRARGRHRPGRRIGPDVLRRQPRRRPLHHQGASRRRPRPQRPRRRSSRPRRPRPAPPLTRRLRRRRPRRTRPTPTTPPPWSLRPRLWRRPRQTLSWRSPRCKVRRPSSRRPRRPTRRRRPSWTPPCWPSSAPPGTSPRSRLAHRREPAGPRAPRAIGVPVQRRRWASGRSSSPRPRPTSSPTGSRSCRAWQRRQRDARPPRAGPGRPGQRSGLAVRGPATPGGRARWPQRPLSRRSRPRQRWRSRRRSKSPCRCRPGPGRVRQRQECGAEGQGAVRADGRGVRRAGSPDRRARGQAGQGPQPAAGHRDMDPARAAVSSRRRSARGSTRSCTT